MNAAPSETWPPALPTGLFSLLWENTGACNTASDSTSPAQTSPGAGCCSWGETSNVPEGW